MSVTVWSVDASTPSTTRPLDTSAPWGARLMQEAHPLWSGRHTGPCERDPRRPLAATPSPMGATMESELLAWAAALALTLALLSLAER